MDERPTTADLLALLEAKLEQEAAEEERDYHEAMSRQGELSFVGMEVF